MKILTSPGRLSESRGDEVEKWREIKSGEREKNKADQRERGVFSSYLPFFPYPPGFFRPHLSLRRSHYLNALNRLQVEAVSFFSIDIMSQQNRLKTAKQLFFLSFM